MLRTGEPQMSETRDAEFESSMSEAAINEDAATGVAAIKKGATSGEKIDTSGAKHSDIGGSDNKSNPEGTENLGAKAAAPVGVEGDKSIKTKSSDAGSGNVSAGLSGKIFDSKENEDGETIQEETPEAEYDFTEDVDALVAGEELSEEFKERAATIFEAAVNSRVAKEKASLTEAFEAALTEQVEQLKTELAEKVDDYISYAAKQWSEENSLAIEHGVKNEIAESFMNGLKSLFEEHHVGVPEEKFNLLDGMVEQIDEMEGKLNEQIESNVSLNKRLGSYIKMEIVNECGHGLTETQKEKLSELSEGVEFESEDDFKSKITTIKESYFTKKEVAPSADPVEDASPVIDETKLTGAMGAYVDTLSRWSK